MRDGFRKILFLYVTLYFVALVFALKVFDVGVAGPFNSKVGLSGLNSFYRNLFDFYGEKGYSVPLYVITELMGLVSIGVCIFFTVLFLREVKKSGSLDGSGVDKNLMATVFLYVIAFVILVLFRFIPVNLRPVLVLNETSLDTSFPSAHVTLFIISFGSAIFHAWETFEKRKKTAVRITAACSVLMTFGIIGRLLSGVCWFTDIIGGILLGSSLLLLYSFFFDF